MLGECSCSKTGASRVRKVVRFVRPLVNYFGGKWNSAEWIISHFPEHEVYVEVFGGSASVLLRKPRSKREVVNDIDDDLVNLYYVARDHGEEFQRVCSLTPHSLTEYLCAQGRTPATSHQPPIERARQTIVKTYFGIGDSMNSKNGFRRSLTANKGEAKSWQSWWEALGEITGRFQGVTIECLDYMNLIEKYDTPQTLFYLDPPYVRATRDRRHGYTHDFTDSDHKELLDRVQQIKGLAVLSGYESLLYSQLPWKRVDRHAQTQVGERTEMLWLCPRTVAAEKQTSFEL